MVQLGFVRILVVVMLMTMVLLPTSTMAETATTTSMISALANAFGSGIVDRIAGTDGISSSSSSSSWLSEKDKSNSRNDDDHDDGKDENDTDTAGDEDRNSTTMHRRMEDKPSLFDDYGIIPVDRDPIIYGDIQFNLSHGIMRMPDAFNNNDLLNMTVHDLFCVNLVIKDPFVTYEADFAELDKEQSFRLDIAGVEMECEGLYNFSHVAPISGEDGRISFKLSDSSMAATMEMRSVDFQLNAPYEASARECMSNVRITDFLVQDHDFIVEATQFIRLETERRYNKMICEYFTDLEKLLNDTVVDIYENMLPYMIMAPNYDMDDEQELKSLQQQEKNMKKAKPEDVTLINYNRPGTSNTAGIIQSFFTVLNLFLSGNSPDDIFLNNFFRNNLNDSNETVVNVNATLGGTLVEELEQYGVTHMEIHNITFKGLNHFQNLTMFDVIGDHSVRFAFAIEDLEMHINGRMDIAYADGVSGSDQHPFSIDLGFERLDLSVAFVLALDEDKFKRMEIFNVMWNIIQGEDPNIFSSITCLFNAIYALEIANIRFNQVHLMKPNMYFEGKELLNEASKIAHVIYDAYQGAMRVDDVWPKMITEYMSFLSGTTIFKGASLFNECPTTPTTAAEANSSSSTSLGGSYLYNGYVDYRDFLVSPNRSITYGGGGMEPYGSSMYLIKELMDDAVTRIDNTTNEYVINKFLGEEAMKQTNQSHRFSVEGDVFSTRRRGGGDSNGDDDENENGRGSAFTIRDFEMMHFNTFDGYPGFNIMDPVMNEPNWIYNAFRLGNKKVSDGNLGDAQTSYSMVTEPFTMQIDLVLDIETELISSATEVRFHMKFDSIEYRSQFQMLLLEEYMLKFTFEELSNMWCWFSLLPKPTLDDNHERTADSILPYKYMDLIASVQNLEIGVDCIKCDDAVIARVVNFIDDLLHGNRVPVFLSEGFNAPSFMETIDQLIVMAPTYCPFHDDYDPFIEPPSFPYVDRNRDNDDKDDDDDDGRGRQPLYVVVSIVLLLGPYILYGFLRSYSGKRQREYLASLPKKEVLDMYAEQEREDMKDSRVNAMAKSLFASPCTTTIGKYLVPFMLIISSILYITGFMMDGIEIISSANILNDNGNTEPLAITTSVNFIGQVREQWELGGGGEVNAIFVVLLSFVWPTMKQIITLVCWFAPSETISVQKRGKTLMVVDLLGKWALFVIFLFLCLIGTIRTSIETSSDWPDGALDLQVFVRPTTGMYLICFAQIWGQLASQTALHYHRLSVRSIARKHAAAAGEAYAAAVIAGDATEIPGILDRDDMEHMHLSVTQPLYQQSFKRKHRGASTALKVRGWVNIAFIAFATLVAIFIILGNTAKLSESKMGGFIGEIGNLVGSELTLQNDFSVLSLVGRLFSLAGENGTAEDYVAYGTLALLLIITVFVIPMLLLVLLCLTWFSSLENASRYLIGVEILQSCNNLEVMFLAVLVNSLRSSSEINSRANDECTAVKPVIDLFARFGLILDSDIECVELDVNLRTGAMVLVISTIMLITVRQFVAQAFIQLMKTTDPSLFTPEALAAVSNAQNNNDAISAKEIIAKMKPSPVLFTDRFRWLLVPDGKDDLDDDMYDLRRKKNVHGQLENPADGGLQGKDDGLIGKDDDEL